MRNNKKVRGFTLIELVAVLVIMAIIALIVTPLVMSIIRKARISADKRSIDAYGRSIELAIAGYLMDTGDFPTSIEQLTIEYSGEEVVCSTTQLKSDSSIYLAGCTVGGRSVDGYTYGKEESVPTPTYTAYSVGDTVTYNNVNYYVIKDSGASEDSVTLLKAEPLSSSEVNQYGGVGTANNHVNMYICYSSNPECYQTTYNTNGYGAIAYYSSVNCGYGTGSNQTYSGCTSDYTQSEIKYVVDAWKTAQAPAATEARLITTNELSNLGYGNACIEEGYCEVSAETPSWVYNSNYWYWTGSQYNDSSSNVWYVNSAGDLDINHVESLGGKGGVVRPVITISKSVISSVEN